MKNIKKGFTLLILLASLLLIVLFGLGKNIDISYAQCLTDLDGNCVGGDTPIDIFPNQAGPDVDPNAVSPDPCELDPLAEGCPGAFNPAVPGCDPNDFSCTGILPPPCENGAEGCYNLFPPSPTETNYEGIMNGASSIDDAYNRVRDYCNTTFSIRSAEQGSCITEGFEKVREAFGGFSGQQNDPCANDDDPVACAAARNRPTTSEQNSCGRTDLPVPISDEGTYSWIGANSCSQSCSGNEECKQFAIPSAAVNPDSSFWCVYPDADAQAGKCMVLTFNENGTTEPFTPIPTETTTERNNRLNTLNRCLQNCQINNDNADSYAACVTGCYSENGNGTTVNPEEAKSCFEENRSDPLICTKSKEATPTPGRTRPTAAPLPSGRTPTPIPPGTILEAGGCVGKGTTTEVTVVAGACPANIGVGTYYQTCKCDGNGGYDNCRDDNPKYRTCGAKPAGNTAKEQQAKVFCNNDSNVGQTVDETGCQAECAPGAPAGVTCGGHQYCIYSPDGNNYPGRCICEYSSDGKSCAGSDTVPASRASTPSSSTTTTPVPTSLTPVPTLANNDKPAVTGFTVNKTTVLAGEPGLSFSATGGKGRFLLYLYGKGAAPTQEDQVGVRCLGNNLSDTCELYNPNLFASENATVRLRDTGGDINSLSATSLTPNNAPTTPGDYWAFIVAKYKEYTCSAIEKILINSNGPVEGTGGRPESCTNPGLKKITVKDASVRSVQITPTTPTAPGTNKQVTITGEANQYTAYISTNNSPTYTDLINAPTYTPTNIEPNRMYKLTTSGTGTTQRTATIPNPTTPGTYYVYVVAHSSTTPWSQYDRGCAWNNRVYFDENGGGNSIGEVTPSRTCQNRPAVSFTVAGTTLTPTTRPVTTRPATTVTTAPVTAAICTPLSTDNAACTRRGCTFVTTRNPKCAPPAAALPSRQTIVQGIPIVSGILNFFADLFQ